MSDLPQGWADTMLGDVIELRYGKGLPEKDRVPGNFDVYGSNGVVGSHTAAVTDAPAIVVGRKGSIGEVHFSETSCFPIDTTYFVDRFDCTEPRFTLHLLRHLPLREMNRASAIPGLNREDAYGLPIALPPIFEQRRIAAKIDSLTGKSRRARDHLDHIPRLVEKYKQAVLAAAFRGELTREWRASAAIPAGAWQTTEMGQIADIGTGATPRRGTSRYYEGGTIPWVTSGSVNEKIIKSSEECITPAALRETNCHLYPVGTLLLAMYGEGKTRGKVAILGIEAATNQALAAIVVHRNGPAARDFVLWYLRSQYFELREQAAGGVQPNLNLGIIKRTRLSLPTYPEQREIVHRLETAFTWIDRLASAATSARRLIDRLNQAVLAKAFRGELVPQDPADEPAGVLLARIREQRGRTEKVKRHRRRSA